MYPCQHPACYSSQHGWTSFATFAYAPVPLYTGIRVAMPPAYKAPSQSGDAPSHSTCSPVSLLPCFPVSMLQWGPGSPKRPYLRPLLAHFDFRTDVASARPVNISLCSPVSRSTGFHVPRFQEEQWLPRNSFLIETRQPGALATCSPGPMLPCLHVSMSLRRCYRPSSHCS
jgi:hypothetical protein